MTNSTLSFTMVALPIMILIGLGIIVLIVVIGLVVKARVSAVGARSFEALITELKADNIKMMTELTIMKESINAIYKMLKEID